MSEEHFKKSLKIGEVGEEKFIEWLNVNNLPFEDVRLNKVYQEKDIDFIMGGYTWEIKTDCQFPHTGNLALEKSTYYRTTGSSRESWFFTSEADIFAFFTPNSKNFAFITREVLHDIYETNYLRSACADDGYKINYLALLPFKKYKNRFNIRNINERSAA